MNSKKENCYQQKKKTWIIFLNRGNKMVELRKKVIISKSTWLNIGKEDKQKQVDLFSPRKDNHQLSVWRS